MVTIEKLLKDAVKIIRQREFNNPLLDGELILSYLLQEDRIYLHLNRKKQVSKELAKEFYNLIEKRNDGYPLQYITKSQEFMGLTFYIEEGVLVPRPDTETLVEKVIKIANEKFSNKEIKILDIGTGSGAIGVSLAYYLKNSMVRAIDISSLAVEIANINAKKYNLSNINIVKGNIFQDIFENEKYHIVVSNPPYIEREEISSLQAEVSTFEPKLALDGGVDGLEYYRRIAEVFTKIYEREGVLSVEIGNKQKEAVEKIFTKTGLFSKIETDKDLSGNNRVITAYVNSELVPT